MPPYMRQEMIEVLLSFHFMRHQLCKFCWPEYMVA